MTALILVDIQNDFFPGGALAVPHGDDILPAVNALMQLPFDHIIATQDWHPKNHGSFAETHHKPIGSIIDLHGVRQILWPTHCVQNTHGSDFAKGWDHSKIHHVIRKGTDPTVDSYSAFFDNELKSSTGLEKFLKDKHIKTVVIAGLATDYCVKYSALDALNLGFKTIIVPAACRGVNLKPEDSQNALKEIEAVGASLLTLDDFKKYFLNCSK